MRAPSQPLKEDGRPRIGNAQWFDHGMVQLCSDVLYLQIILPSSKLTAAH